MSKIAKPREATPPILSEAPLPQANHARNWKKQPMKFGKMNIRQWKSTGPRKVRCVSFWKNFSHLQLKSKEKPGAVPSGGAGGARTIVTRAGSVLNEKEGYVNTPITRSTMRHLPAEDQKVVTDLNAVLFNLIIRSLKSSLTTTTRRILWRENRQEREAADDVIQT